jgi:hypothetical protein
VPIYLNGVGTVIAYNTDVVRAQIQGQITSINFKDNRSPAPIALGSLWRSRRRADEFPAHSRSTNTIDWNERNNQLDCCPQVPLALVAA